jgi:nucleotide-binding universal stress UspA family protein
LGGHFACVQSAIRDNVGTGLFPQAGMAIGFTFLLSADPNFRDSAQIITSIVLVGVFLSELLGPVCTKRALTRCGEAAPEPEPSGTAYDPLLPTSGGTEIRLLPWTWQKLPMPPSRSGTVIFGVSQKKTVCSLARLATLLAHYHQATPCALSVKPRDRNLPGDRIIDDQELFALAEEEVRALGYDLSCRTIEAENIAKGLLAGAEKYQARAIIMGYPLEHKESQYSQVVDLVAGQAECEIIVARFIGILHTERILVPIVHDWNMEVVESCLCSLVNVGRHRVTLLHLLPTDTSGSDFEGHEKKLHAWATRKNLPFASCVTRKVDSRIEEIIDEARHHDLVIMATGENMKLRKVFFGSLADDVAEQCDRPTLIIHSRAHRRSPTREEK